MRVLIVSKALISAAYREKLTELGRLGVEAVAAVPPEWREGGSIQRLEGGHGDGFRLIEVPMRLNGHFHLHHYPSLPAVIQTVMPDLVHMDEEPYNFATYRGVMAARRAKVPSLFFSWQNLLRRYPPPFSWFETAVFRSVSHALAGSAEVAEVLRAKGYRGPLSVIPQFGVDPTVFRPGTRRDGPFTIGFFNRLIPAKGPAVALEAFSRLPGEPRLRFVGDGSARGEIEREIVRRHLEGRVTIEPRIPSSEMPAAVRGVDVIILPSLSTSVWKEQFGRILIEAMASGIPVVGSDSGEIPRVVGTAGLIVPEGDAPALASALVRLIREPELRERLGVLGRQRVLDHFTHARIAEATVDAYRRALGEET
jgi:glycosyltransferase involved in cell wall biosynthesis